MSNEITIRPYAPEDEVAWLRCHAVIMTISHAWNYAIQERPAYAGHTSTRLVACLDDAIVGLTDVQYETEVGEFCFVRDSLGGYVLEFGRLPEYGGLGIGGKLIEATRDDAKAKGFHRLEYWSQDRNAQRFYRRYGMKEIGRHYRFRFKAPKALADTLLEDYVGVEYIYGACMPEEWPLVKQKYEIITKHPLEPHLCVGFELRF